MSGKVYLKQSIHKEDNSNNQTDWHKWCRLCATPEVCDAQERCTFPIKNDAGKLDAELVTSIGKYFWVNIKADDETSLSLCVQCKQLIEELISFTEHVNKVQTLFCLLQNMKPSTSEQAMKLRSHCGLINESFQHIIRKGNPLQLYIHKSDQIDQQLQTDTIPLDNNNQNLQKSIAEIKQTLLIKESVKSVEEQESESDMETEYILQSENDLEFLDCTNHIEENENKKIEISEEEKELEIRVHTEQEEGTKEQGSCEEEEDEVQDSDIFKELNCNLDEVDEAETNHTRYKINSKEGELKVEYQNDDDELEESVEVLEDDDDDYINTQEYEKEKAKALLLYKGKRGRPKGQNVYKYLYECKECKRKYKNPNVYRKHMTTIHNVEIEDLPDFKCSVCDMSCFTESRLKLHMRQHLSDEEKFNVPCPYCDRKFSQVGTMRQHVNGIHHQMKPFICDQCGRACKTMAAVLEHKLVHTDECPFECDVCHKKFKNKARLKSHLDIHTHMMYKCPECGLKLNTKRTLLQHRQVHSDEKRYKCEFCDSAFKRSKALKTHLILHTGLRPYKCTFCSKTFSNGSNCRAHKRRAHPKELAEEEANGKTAEIVNIPRLEELKSANGVLVQPRKVKRKTGGLPDHLRKLLQAADKRKKPNDSSESDQIDKIVDNLESLEEYPLEIDESNMEETTETEECQETVIYEIIQEI